MSPIQEEGVDDEEADEEEAQAHLRCRQPVLHKLQLTQRRQQREDLVPAEVDVSHPLQMMLLRLRVVSHRSRTAHLHEGRDLPLSQIVPIQVGRA